MPTTSRSSLVHVGSADATSLWRVVHKPRIAVRSNPSLGASVAFVFPVGQIFRAKLAESAGWVQLLRDELWVHQLSDGYVLIDGFSLGLGQLIEPAGEDVEKHEWPYAMAVSRSARLGVPFNFDQDSHMRPPAREKLESRWLSLWHDEVPTEPATWLGHLNANPELADRPALTELSRTKLAVALLVRGVPFAPLSSFVQYHLSIGFQRVALYFDDPEDAQEEHIARSVTASCSGHKFQDAEVQVHLCTKQWWHGYKRDARFYSRQNATDNVYNKLIALHEDVHDVQARQCLVIDHAIREAHRDGFDWLLHIDSDEALVCPKHMDTRSFFAQIPSEFEQVVFPNLEGVPESLDGNDYFKEISLFKVNQSLLREDPKELPVSEKRQKRLQKWRDKKIAKGCDPDDLDDNRSFNQIVFCVRMSRREAALNLQLDLPLADPDSEFESASDLDDSSRQKDRRHSPQDIPSYFTAYTNGKSAVRLRQNTPPPLPVGVHRCTSDENRPLRSYKSKGPGAPVILHYANCSLSSWKRKYQILSSGHGTADGGFSVTRKGVKSMRAHLMHREILRHGTEEEIERYYRTFVMGEEYGDLPYLAAHGLLARTSAVRLVLENPN